MTSRLGDEAEHRSEAGRGAPGHGSSCMKTWQSVWILIPLVLLSLSTRVTHAEDSSGDADSSDRARWQPHLDVRARYELADSGDREKAQAATLRGRAGLTTPRWQGLSGFGAVELAQALDTTSYQAASVSGRGRNLTIIADPESTEIHELGVRWSGETGSFALGRQSIVLDGARFVGDVGWRQNAQSYDAAVGQLEVLDKLTVQAAHIWRVNRIFGSGRAAVPGQRDFDSRSFLLHADYVRFPEAQLAGYAYRLDLRNAAGGDASNSTLGLRLKGERNTATVSLAYHLELARQVDAASSTLDYRADYAHARISGRAAGVTVGAGYELLGGDRGVGFQTPLATLHKYNGFADVFLTTPSAGLADRYGWLQVPLPLRAALTVAHHDFVADDSRGDFGRELDLVLGCPLPLGLRGTIKYAAFTSESALPDLRRLVVQIELRR